MSSMFERSTPYFLGLTAPIPQLKVNTRNVCWQKSREIGHGLQFVDLKNLLRTIPKLGRCNPSKVAWDCPICVFE